MAGNTFGKLFSLTTFGESHGKAIGGIIDGCPSGIKVDLNLVQFQMDRRKPGQSKIVTQRSESDEVEFLSGVFEGKTTGTPIGFLIQNKDSRSILYVYYIVVFSFNSVLQLNDNFNYCIIFEWTPANTPVGVGVSSRFRELLTMSITVTVEFDFRSS